MQDMEPMTPEERWIRIENAMQHLLEVHAEVEAGHRELQALHREAEARHKEIQAQQDSEISKHQAAIRDLIVVSRIFLESQKQLTVQVQSHQTETAEFREKMNNQWKVQEHMSEKLHALIDTVDRIIRDTDQ